MNDSKTLHKAGQAIRNSWWICLCAAFTFFLIPQKSFPQTVVINEILAANHSFDTDENGDYEDWIELYNASGGLVNIGGYTLSDNPANPTKWTIPTLWMPANGFVRVWASNKDRTSPLHTNFQLDVEGEYVGLYDASQQLVDSVTFGAQKRDLSYGRKPDGSSSWVFFATPTPAQSNATEGRVGYVVDPMFTPVAGVYSSAQSVQIQTPTPNSTLRYTLGGYTPTSASPFYSGGISVTTTTVIRSQATRAGYWPSDVVTQTYFVNANSETPLMSLVVDPNQLAQIYYANLSGLPGERPGSVEYWEANGVPGFEVTCGVRIHGGASKSRDNIHKKSFRLHFRRDVGPSKLNYPIFDDTDVDRFNKLVLRANYNDGWTHWSPTQRENATEVRDEQSRALRLEMGDLAMHGTHCALWLNGHHWGVYNITERMEGDFLDDYFDHEGWDVIALQSEVKEGDGTAWNNFHNWYASNDLSVDANYQQLQTMVDLDNFTNYMILNMWQRNTDWPHHNGFAARARNLPGAKWMYFDWDTEGGYGGGPQAENDAYNMWTHGTSTWVMQLLLRLTANADYRVHFGQQTDIMLNTVLDEPHVYDVMWEEALKIRPIIPQEAQWRVFYGEWSDVTRWEAALARSNAFNYRRTPQFRAHTRDRLAEITGWRDVVVDPPEGGEGYVYMHDVIRPQIYPWFGQFFDGIPLVLKAVPKPGFQFVGWSDGSLPTTDTVSITFGAGGAGGTLISPGSTWRYNDTGTDLGTAWRTVGYIDSAWGSGQAELGYGDGDEQTTLNYGPSPTNKYPTYYFRHSFNVLDKSQYGNLTMRVKRDDGVVVYLNNTFIYKSANMTSAPSSIEYADYAVGGGDTWDTGITVDPMILNNGPNVVAAEIHQNGPTSSDISFDLELTSGAPGSSTYTIHAIFGVDPNPPEVLSVEFVARNRMIVEFNRPLFQASAEFEGNYSVDNGVGAPTVATLWNDTTVLLEFGSNLSPGMLYTLSAINVQPAVGNPIPPGSPATGTASYVIPPVTINEVMYNTHGSDVEWIELHNTTAGPQDVSGWYLTDDESYPALGEGNWSVPAGTVIPAHGYIVLGLDRDMSDWNFPPGVPFVQGIVNSGGNLNNGGDNLALYNGPTGGSLIDGSLLKEYPDLSTAGHSLEKNDEEFPWRSHPAAWHASTVEIGWYTPLAEFATPGRGNSTGGGSASSVRDWRLY